MKINTLEIQATRHTDQHGNTYNSANVIINCHEETETNLYLPFGYGYDDHYKTRVMELLKSEGFIKSDNRILWRYCEENNIKLFANVYDVKAQKDMV